MDLVEASEKRRSLELDILNFTYKKCVEFEKKTGLYISGVSIETINVSEMGTPQDAIAISGCTVVANI